MECRLAEIYRCFMHDFGSFNPKREGGGADGPPPPPPPPLDVSRDNFAEMYFFRAANFHDFLLKFCATFGATMIFGKIGHTVRKLRNIMLSSGGSKCENFLDLCTNHMENGFLCQNSILSSKMQYLLSLELKSLLYSILKQFHIIIYSGIF